MAYKAFISYSHGEHGREARKIHQALTRFAMMTWMSPQRPSPSPGSWPSAWSRESRDMSSPITPWHWLITVWPRSRSHKISMPKPMTTSTGQNSWSTLSSRIGPMTKTPFSCCSTSIWTGAMPSTGTSIQGSFRTRAQLAADP